MEELRNRPLKDTFHTKLKTPWVWLIVLITIGLTILFSLSQKPQIVVYSEYIQTLSDYQLLEVNLMRSMEQIRSGYSSDTIRIQAQTMTLREMAVSFSRRMDELNSFQIKTPPTSLTARFEREVIAKVSSTRRYASARARWNESINEFANNLLHLNSAQYEALQPLLTAARAGRPCTISDSLPLPDSTKHALDSLLNVNNDLAMAWARFNNDATLLSAAELVQFFQMERMREMALKAKIPMVFYFLTLVLLLSTFFFIYRSKQ